MSEAVKHEHKQFSARIWFFGLFLMSDPLRFCFFCCAINDLKWAALKIYKSWRAVGVVTWIVAQVIIAKWLYGNKIVGLQIKF